MARVLWVRVTGGLVQSTEVDLGDALHSSSSSSSSSSSDSLSFDLFSDPKNGPSASLVLSGNLLRFPPRRLLSLS